MFYPRRYTRRVSSLERYSLALHEAHHYQLCAIVEGSGDLDPARLQAAVDAASAANPGVRVRLRGWLAASRWVDSGVAPRVRVLHGLPWEDRCADTLEPMMERLDPLRGGPVADVLLLPGAKGRACLVFRGLHGAFDGRGLMHWMRDVFRALRDESLQGSTSTLTAEDVQRQYRDRVAAADAAASPASTILSVLPPTGPGAETDPLAYTWRCLKIPRKVPHVMLHSALFFADWARRHGSGRVSFTVPVDFRGLRTQEHSTGNLIGYLRLEVGEDDSPRTLTRQLTQALRQHVDCREISALRGIAWRPVHKVAKAARDRLQAALHSSSSPSGGLVSLGSAYWEEMRFPGFEPDFVYSVPPFVGRLNAIFVELPDCTIATLSLPRACARDGALDEMAAAYLQCFAE